MNVSNETAQFFMDQCAGNYSGHMANIPNNPVIHSLLVAHNAHNTQESFVLFLRACADQLANQGF